MAPIPANKNRRSRAERSAQFREHLLSTVERLLDGESFPEITIDRILNEASVSRSTFYFHFDDKASLLLAMAQDLFDDAQGVATPWWNLTRAASRDDLESAIGGIFDVYLPHKAVYGALVDAAGYEPAVRAQLATLQQSSIDMLEEHIVRGQREGFIRDVLLPAQTAGWIIWMIERGLHQMVAGATTAQIGRLLTAVTDVVWFSLYENAASSPVSAHPA